VWLTISHEQEKQSNTKNLEKNKLGNERRQTQPHITTFPLSRSESDTFFRGDDPNCFLASLLVFDAQLHISISSWTDA
jgi:hypothetical protein